MTFNTYFRASSYAMIAVAMLALLLAGGMNLALAVGFALVMIGAWKLEGTKWQLSERFGLIVVLLSLPLFYLDWKFFGLYPDLNPLPPAGPHQTAGVSALAHLILFLSAIKLLQVKSDRDWVFLYLISFFEVLLAAGLSLSPVFLASLSVYLICGLSTVIAFEIQKARRNLKPAETRLLVPPDSPIFRRLARHGVRRGNIEVRRLPLTTVVLLTLIFTLALPLFFIAPRAGSASFTRGGAGLTNLIGFSESVTLGEIGTLKQNNDVVMHVRLEDPLPTGLQLKWRGVALDEFTGRGWKKSLEARRSTQIGNERGFYQLGTTEALHRLTTQTIFLEPIDTAILFAAPRPVALQGPFPFIRIDGEGSIQSRHHELDRVIYKAVSDTAESNPEPLRRDLRLYPASFARYLQLPGSLDPRISDLARAIVISADARNRYDAARAIERQLQTNYGYTLEMKAGGPDPLADFLFNVRTGHCEYFSSAMVVMLRTRGIAARVVNGFLSGEYNDAAGAYTVRQSNAHSWVEVYFPETDSWVTFDPTPAAGRTSPERAGLAAYLGKYTEAFELLWFQYVVGYDKQEQRSLAASMNNRLFSFRRALAQTIAHLKQAPLAEWRRVLLVAFVVFAAGLLLWYTRRLGWQRRLRIKRHEDEAGTSAVEFYERLTKLLADRGIKREPNATPLEFASELDFQPALLITLAYNRVRYGGQRLSSGELRDIESSLKNLETTMVKETKAEMMRKKSTNRLSVKILSLILTSFCALTIPVAHGTITADKREIVGQATQSYYSLRKLGLLEFKANVQPNWALVAKNYEANPGAMKMLNGLIFSVSLKPDGSVKVEHESSVPIPADQEENVKQMYAGMDEMLSGFFGTWNFFMLTPPFPAADSEYQLQELAGKYLLTYKDGNADVTTTMTRELAIEEVKVSSQAFKSSLKPQFTKTQRGYVLVGYHASYEPTSGAGKTKLDIQIDYQEVNGLELPRKLSLDAIYDGSPVQMELQFSQYQLKTR